MSSDEELRDKLDVIVKNATAVGYLVGAHSAVEMAIDLIKIVADADPTLGPELAAASVDLGGASTAIVAALEVCKARRELAFPPD